MITYTVDYLQFDDDGPEEGDIVLMHAGIDRVEALAKAAALSREVDAGRAYVTATEAGIEVGSCVFQDGHFCEAEGVLA